MRFSLNGRTARAFKLDFEFVQLMTVFEPEIKMAARNRKKALNDFRLNSVGFCMV